jgi:hypothetical protein
MSSGQARSDLSGLPVFWNKCVTGLALYKALILPTTGLASRRCRCSAGRRVIIRLIFDVEIPMGNQVSDNEKMLARFQALKKSQHWLAGYIDDLLTAHHLSGSIDFSAAERLLSAEKGPVRKGSGDHAAHVATLRRADSG